MKRTAWNTNRAALYGAICGVVLALYHLSVEPLQMGPYWMADIAGRILGNAAGSAILFWLVALARNRLVR